MKAISFILPFVLVCILASCEEASITPLTPPEEYSITISGETGDCSEITYRSARLSGKIELTNIRNDISAGFLYSKSSEPTVENSKEAISRYVNKDGSFFVDVTNLDSSSKYYYRTFIQFNGKVYMGDVRSFLTKDIPVVISVGDVSEIQLFSAVVNGSIKSDDGTIIEQGFLFLSSEESEVSHIIRSDYKLNFSCDKTTGAFSIYLPKLRFNTDYYLVVGAHYYDKDVLGPVVSFRTNDYVYSATPVDLGLPSGTMWADRNLGAISPEDAGAYFAWGETEPKEYYRNDNYKWSSSDSWIKYYIPGRNPSGKVELDKNDDPACIKLGSQWHTPTRTQIYEMNRYCVFSPSVINGIEGCLVTGMNGNTIFLPFSGYYAGSGIRDKQEAANFWTSDVVISHSSNLLSVYEWVARTSEDIVSFYATNMFYCYYGLSVRPVYETSDE